MSHIAYEEAGRQAEGTREPSVKTLNSYLDTSVPHYPPNPGGTQRRNVTKLPNQK